MLTNQTLIIINIASIAFLVIQMAVLIAATRMKGGAGWAALIIVATTVPVYLLNLTREIPLPQIYCIAAYFACFLNPMCIPALWFFVRSQLDRSFRFTARSSLHLIPAAVSLTARIAGYSSMSAAQISETINLAETGREDLTALVNSAVIAAQLLVYFPVMFRYIWRRKKYLKVNHIGEHPVLRWTHNFIALFFGLFVVVLVVYAIDPRFDVWLIPILNVVAMGYLTYTVIGISTGAYAAHPPAISPERGNCPPVTTINEMQMKYICERITEYMQSSGAYNKSDFSIHTLALETGFQYKNISAAINGHLHKNFFEFVNAMRIGEAKRLLLELDSGYTIDSVYAKCGFRSRSSFFMTFKKIVGASPAQWLKMNRPESEIEPRQLSFSPGRGRGN